MRIKFRFKEKKALDALIVLENVPFDTNKFDEVKDALLTIPDVNNVVQLVSRTDRSMNFNFTGEEKILKEFFERFYASRSWDEIKKKFDPNRKKITKEKSDPSIKTLVRKLEDLLIRSGARRVSIDLKDNSLILNNVEKSVLSKLYSGKDLINSPLIKLLESSGYNSYEIKSNESPPRIILKSI